MDREPFHSEVIVRHRALLGRAKDYTTLRDQAEVNASKWYDEPIPIEELVKKAKELGKDVITLETQTIVERCFYVERGD